MTSLGRRTVLATGIGAALAPRAMAQTYPDRAIRMVVPAAAGGPTDVVGRILQPQLNAILGQPVVIENKAGGATGNIGTAVVAD
jgi:tripartite-type tricarboxylate transporter receptor subunit TctC